MSPEMQSRIFAHTQAVARHFIAWKGALPSLIPFVAYSIGESAPSPDEIENFLKRNSTQEELLQRWETVLRRSLDGSWRLVCLAVPDNVNIARQRLSHFPVSRGTSCRWCSQDEHIFAADELKPVLDANLVPVAGSYCHPTGCMASWLLMQNFVNRADAKSEREKLI